jgi:hypothetical protein
MTTREDFLLAPVANKLNPLGFRTKVHGPVFGLFVLACLCLALAGCSGSDTLPEPDWLYGTWTFSGSSGGITGEGIPETESSSHQIVFTENHVAEIYQAGNLVRTRTFSVGSGDTIFGLRHIIEFDDGEVVVIELVDDDTLSLSQDEYDGFSFTYLREK